MLVRKKAAARMVVARVSAFAWPRPVRKPETPLEPPPRPSPPALRALQQHDADEREHDEKMDDDKHILHGTPCCAFAMNFGFAWFGFA